MVIIICSHCSHKQNSKSKSKKITCSSCNTKFPNPNFKNKSQVNSLQEESGRPKSGLENPTEVGPSQTPKKERGRAEENLIDTSENILTPSIEEKIEGPAKVKLD